MSDRTYRSDQDSEILDAKSIVSDNRPRRQLTSLQKIGIAGVMLAVFLGFIWLRALENEKDKANQQADAQPPFSMGVGYRPAPLQAPPPPPPLPLPTATTLPLAMPLPQQAHNEITPVNSPIMAFSGGGLGQAIGQATSAAPPAPVTSEPDGSQKPPETALSQRLKPTVLSATNARMLPHPDFMLTKGTVIACTLQTAINSELAGYVKCVLPQDVRSTTGDVVLLDKGTTVVGEIQSGLAQGQDRVFVLWDRAETPDHAIIDLGSPGTDELGRSGLPGAVNNHFWKRFGSAIMLSVIQGGLQAGTVLAASGHGSSNNSIYFSPFQENGQELADTALLNAINIPPTLEKNQGDNVAIFVAHDLDFSDVYSLRTRTTAASGGGRAYGQ